MAHPGQLGEFLQARRAQVVPDDVGLATGDERRRVPGLRREELAQLAGVSAPYYGRLEQGVSANASRLVLDAIATALRLSDPEREHLHRLASQQPAVAPTAADRPDPERAGEATLRLLGQMDGVPAVLQGRFADVLAWNPLGHALLAGHVPADAPDDPARRPNVARLVFGDAHTSELYADWPRKARAIVGYLRQAAGRHPDDPRLAALVGELSMASEEFAGMWAEHEIRVCEAADYELRHPVVGAVIVTQQSLAVTQSPDQTLVVLTPRPGSASEDAVRMLGQAGVAAAAPLAR